MTAPLSIGVVEYALLVTMLINRQYKKAGFVAMKSRM
jgi:hypothetical protein